MVYIEPYIYIYIERERETHIIQNTSTYWVYPILWNFLEVPHLILNTFGMGWETKILCRICRQTWEQQRFLGGWTRLCFKMILKTDLNILKLFLSKINGQLIQSSRTLVFKTHKVLGFQILRQPQIKISWLFVVRPWSISMRSQTQAEWCYAVGCCTCGFSSMVCACSGWGLRRSVAPEVSVVKLRSPLLPVSGLRWPWQVRGALSWSRW